MRDIMTNSEITEDIEKLFEHFHVKALWQNSDGNWVYDCNDKTIVFSCGGREQLKQKITTALRLWDAVKSQLFHLQEILKTDDCSIHAKENYEIRIDELQTILTVALNQAKGEEK